METPRRGLVRATEKAIRQYIQSDVASNLGIISQLEDIAFSLWAESNTGFIVENGQTEDPDMEADDLAWDDDLPTVSVQTPVTSNTEAEIYTTTCVAPPLLPWDQSWCSQDLDMSIDTPDMDLSRDLDEENKDPDVSHVADSSLGSWMRPCDDSCCSHGYLACSESSRLRSPCSPEKADRGSHDICTPYARTKSSHTTNTDVEMNSRREISTLTDHAASQSNVCMNVSETADSNSEDWVMVEKAEAADWLVISTRDTQAIPRTASATTNYRPEQSSTRPDTSMTSPDLEDWSILSLNITERPYAKYKPDYAAQTHNPCDEMERNVSSNVLKPKCAYKLENKLMCANIDSQGPNAFQDDLREQTLCQCHCDKDLTNCRREGSKNDCVCCHQRNRHCECRHSECRQCEKDGVMVMRFFVPKCCCSHCSSNLCSFVSAHTSTFL